MSYTTSNGSRPVTGPNLPSWNALNSASHKPHWSHSHSSDDVAVALAYKAKGRRRAAIAAKAHARRRRLTNAFLTVLVGAALLSCAYTLHREQNLLELEQTTQP